MTTSAPRTEDEHATSAQHDAMERAAHMTEEEALHPEYVRPGGVDRLRAKDRLRARGTLPRYRETGMPENATRHAMDEALRNCRRIPRGPIGWA